MRLIDADKLRKDVLDLPNCYNGFSDTYDKAMIVDLVDEQPTVDAETVKHGHWIFKPKDAIEMMFTLPKCSECGAESSDAGNYCPYCGAKMDEEEQDNASI